MRSSEHGITSSIASGIASSFERGLLRVADPPVQQGMTPAHRARHLFDPSQGWEASDPFLALAEDWFPRGVFDNHPHRGIETVTYVLAGRLDHYDSRGNQGSIGVGDAQWMTAGRGVIHNEVPAADSVVHSLQLWVNLPAAQKMAEPRYQDLVGAKMPVRREPGVEVRVFSGVSGAVRAPTLNHVPVTYLELRLEPGAAFTQELPAAYNGFVLVLEGECGLGTPPTGLHPGQLAWLTRPDAESGGAGQSHVTLRAGPHPLRALLVAGQPLREPVVAYGPFVMNTEQQIVEAFQDYRAGRFD